MLRRLPVPAAVLAAAMGLVALAMRLHNVVRYPPDWGFDASFNWRYIYRLTQDLALPPPGAGWSTADPPLFFALGALLYATFKPISDPLMLVAIPLLNTVMGFGVVWLAADLARRADPDRPLRVVLAAGTLLFLPAHVQMSVMVNEEMLSTLLVSLSIYAVAVHSWNNRPSTLRDATGAGLAAGLALLTKLSGGVAMLAAAGAVLSEIRHGQRWRPALANAAVIVLMASALGGWFYVRGSIFSAYLDPEGLDVHAIMREMPPGERSLGDFVRVPIATFADPQLLNPDLLRSVWGSTYATWWFDGHRFFLPTQATGVQRLGTLTLILALLPSAAFLWGCGRGVRRLVRGERGPDAPLLLLMATTAAAYALYTWSNPYFTVVKGTSLLGIAVPFAYYASEGLERWARGPRPVAVALWVLLLALACCVTAGFSFGLVFERTEVSGLPWQ
jgi:hypothetical protein